MRRDLEAAIAGWEADAAALRRTGDERTAAILERCANEARAGAEEWLTWLSEADAAIRSGHKRPWFVARREAWRSAGHARQVSRYGWEYRACIVPKRANLALAAAEGVEAARKMKGAA